MKVKMDTHKAEIQSDREEYDNRKQIVEFYRKIKHK